jgi:hypothetical protein
MAKVVSVLSRSAITKRSEIDDVFVGIMTERVIGIVISIHSRTPVEIFPVS